MVGDWLLEKYGVCLGVEGVVCHDEGREGLSEKAILQMLVSTVDQSFNPVAAAFSRKCLSYTSQPPS